MAIPRTSGALSAVLFLVLAVTASPVIGQVVISQVYGGGGNSGAPFNADFVELFNAGPSAQSIDGWSIQYTSAAGNSWGNQTTPLPNAILEPGQYFLVSMATGGTGGALPTPDVVGSTNMAAGSGKVLLANTTATQSGSDCPAGPQIIDLVPFGTNANCTPAAPQLGNTLAAHRGDNGCMVTGNPANDFTALTPAPRNSASPFAPCGGPGLLTLGIANASAPEGDAGTSPMTFQVSLSGPAPTGGVDFTASTADGTAVAGADYIALVDEAFAIAEGDDSAEVTVLVIGNTIPEPDKTFTVTIQSSTANIVVNPSVATGTILNDDNLVLEIFEIQGDGPRSPYAPISGNDLGDLVATNDNIVTAIASNGFFMQTPEDRDDNDPLTSNGLFVFTGSAPSVAIGDRVDVSGRVQEYFNWTQLAGSPSVTVVGTGALPTAIVFDENLPSTDPDNLSCGFSNFECFENMLVHAPASHAGTGNQTFGNDPYAENFVSFGAYRARREEGLRFGLSVPSRPELPVWDGNPEVIDLDADALGAVPPDTGINGGAVFSATGVIAFEFGNHEFWPTTLELVDAPLPRPVPEPAGPAELRLGSLNVENLCAQGCGDPPPSPVDFALKLARLSDYIGNVLLLPDVLGLQEVEFDDSVQALVDRIELDHGLTYAFYTGIGNDPREIRNAYLINTARVEVINVEDLGADETIDQCSGTPPCAKHDRPPVLLEARFTAGNDEPFRVMVVHNRSLSGIVDTGSGGQRVRFKRFAQASSIAGFVQDLQTSILPVEDRIFASNFELQVPLVVLGDFNAFEVTDGLVDMVGLIAGTYDDERNEFQLLGPNLVNPPLHNLVLDLELDERYSFSFRENLGNVQGQSPRQVGSIQVLDHGLIDQAGLGWCPSLHYGRGNADAPERLRAVGTGAVASSDHDGFVIRLHPTAANGVSRIAEGQGVCTAFRAGTAGH